MVAAMAAVAAVAAGSGANGPAGAGTQGPARDGMVPGDNTHHLLGFGSQPSGGEFGQHFQHHQHTSHQPPQPHPHQHQQHVSAYPLAHRSHPTLELAEGGFTHLNATATTPDLETEHNSEPSFEHASPTVLQLNPSHQQHLAHQCHRHQQVLSPPQPLQQLRLSPASMASPPPQSHLLRASSSCQPPLLPPPAPLHSTVIEPGSPILRDLSHHHSPSAASLSNRFAAAAFSANFAAVTGHPYTAAAMFRPSENSHQQQTQQQLQPRANQHDQEAAEGLASTALVGSGSSDRAIREAATVAAVSAAASEFFRAMPHHASAASSHLDPHSGPFLQTPLPQPGNESLVPHHFGEQTSDLHQSFANYTPGHNPPVRMNLFGQHQPPMEAHERRRTKREMKEMEESNGKIKFAGLNSRLSRNEVVGELKRCGSKADEEGQNIVEYESGKDEEKRGTESELTAMTTAHQIRRRSICQQPDSMTLFTRFQSALPYGRKVVPSSLNQAEAISSSRALRSSSDPLVDSDGRGGNKFEKEEVDNGIFEAKPDSDNGVADLSGTRDPSPCSTR
ncbi:unnamed protein product [Protopolystoma xenopodis]|uniref:Uncharacterized protein n=1 Tax=Protopolystoma xenopodis TaxID=117903 RepID=A0A3S5A5C2_9PLAT|nr:unnamed protein product [Protopolystoma xenopodis]